MTTNNVSCSVFTIMKPCLGLLHGNNFASGALLDNLVLPHASNLVLVPRSPKTHIYQMYNDTVGAWRPIIHRANQADIGRLEILQGWPYQHLLQYMYIRGVAIPLPPPHPPPQPNLKVSQYNQTYRWKVKSFSAMDFQYFHFISIFTTFFILSNKNAKININCTQYMLFVSLFITLYRCYGFIL